MGTYTCRCGRPGKWLLTEKPPTWDSKSITFCHLHTNDALEHMKNTISRIRRVDARSD